MKPAPLQTARAAAEFDPARTESELVERCDRLVGRARDLGADEAEAYATQAQTIAARFEKGDLKLVQVGEGASTGLRVFHGRRLGFASTNQADDRSLAHTASDALGLSKHAPPHAANVLPAARPITRGAPLYDRELAGSDVDRVVDLGAELVSRARAVDPRLSIDSASAELTRASHAVRATTGVAVGETDATLSFSIFGMAIDGQDVGGFHYGGDVVRAGSAVEAALNALLDEFTSVALGNLGAGRAESYRGPVLFAPDAFLDLLVAPVLSASSAIAVQRGRSALASKLGARIAFEGFDLADDPSDRELAGAGAFDREGQPTARYPLVARGVLQGFLYNGFAAAVEGRTSTGHAAGGPRSVPSLGARAAVVSGGAGGTRAQLERALGRGLYVQRFSGTVDPASGDFSGVAKSARWIENGVPVRGVRETLLSGNAFDLLRRIVALSDRAERCSGAARAPYALVDGVDVTAG